MSIPPYRRLWGLVLGLATGAIFALVSQLANIFAMPGVPLFQPPFGAAGNILLGALIGALIGFTASWPENAFLGILWSSLIGWLAVSAASVFSGQASQETIMNRIAALLIIIFPIVGFMVPFMALFRWIISREEQGRIEQQRLGTPWQPKRLLLPLALLLVAGWLGYQNLYPPRGQNAAIRAHQMIEQGRQAASEESLPQPLRPPNVVGFRAKAAGEYSLRWDLDEKNRYAIPRPAGNDPASAVITQFDNGWLLVCIYTSPDRDPNCRGFDELPQFLNP